MAAGTPEDLTTEDCCAADPRIARYFDTRIQAAAAAGELPEMAQTSRTLLELLADIEQQRPTLLELGAGSGALTVALLERGAVSADAVDLSPESVAAARRRAEAAGVAERTNFAVGDGARVELAAHDWVVLDRVLCCYRHVDRLLGNAIRAADRRIAFSVPEAGGWRGLVNRLIVVAENATNRLRGRPCPGYVHPLRAIEGPLTAAGFRRLRNTTVGLWYAAVWERPNPPR